MDPGKGGVINSKGKENKDTEEKDGQRVCYRRGVEEGMRSRLGFFFSPPTPWNQSLRECCFGDRR